MLTVMETLEMRLSILHMLRGLAEVACSEDQSDIGLDEGSLSSHSEGSASVNLPSCLETWSLCAGALAFGNSALTLQLFQY